MTVAEILVELSTGQDAILKLGLGALVANRNLCEEGMR